MPSGNDEKHAASSTFVKRDEAIQKMFSACQLRFQAPQFEVQCDDGGTVWVKHVDKSRSIGLQPWLLRSRTTDEVIRRAEKKLGL